MSVKLELEITLDSKGAVSGVKTLDGALTRLDKTTQTTTKTGKGFMDSMFAQVTAANLATKGISILTNVVKDSVSKYMEAETIQSKLNTMLDITGENARGAADRIDDFANKMQYLTGVDSDQVKMLETLARQYEMQTDKIDESVKAAVALTNISGSLESNLKALDNAYRGNWTQLNKLIPAIGQAKTESEKMAILQQKISEGFTMSTKAMQTNAGQMLAMKNDLGDLAKAAGEGIVKALNLGINALTNNQMAVRRLGQEYVANFELMKMNIENWRKSYKGTWQNEAQEMKDAAYEAGILADAERVLNRDVEEESKTTKEHTVVIKTLNEIMEERWAATVKQFDEDKAYATFVESKLGPAIESYSDSFANSIGITNMMTDAEKEFDAEIERQANQIFGENIPATKDLAAEMEKFNDIQQYTAALISGITDLLSDLGYELTEAEQGIMDFGISMINLGTAVATGNIPGIISGVIGAIAGLAKAIFSKGETYEEFKERMEKIARGAEDLKNSMENLASTISNYEGWDTAALEKYVDVMNMSIESFEEYKKQVSEMSGTDGTALWMERYGEQFTALINKAMEAGQEGSAELIGMFENLAAKGMRVAEVEAYIAEQLGAGLEGYEKMKEAIASSKDAQEAFGNLNIKVYEEMIRYQNKIAKNKGLTDAIDGATKALIGLSNTTRLTEAQYDQFEQSAESAYDKLRESGFTEKESLQQLAPMLARLKFLHEQYGLTLDAETLRLLELADANGVNTDNAMTEAEALQDISTSLRELVKLFGGTLPDAIGKTTEAYKKLNNEAGEYSPDHEAPETKTRISAASGFYSPRLSQDTRFQAHAPEPVAIGESGFRAAGLSGGKTTNINITLVGSVTPEIAADAIKTAYINNTRGLKSLLEN